MERLNRAAALAATLYGPELQTHVRGLFARVHRANETGGTDFSFEESNAAIGELARYFWQELDVEQAIKHQKQLFQPDWTRWVLGDLKTI